MASGPDHKKLLHPLNAENSPAIQTYVALSNQWHSPVSEMQATASTVAQAFTVSTMNWNDYQTTLIPAGNWPAGLFDNWAAISSSMSDNIVSPPALSDVNAAVQRCFTQPAAGQTALGIPIICAVGTNTDGSGKHKISLDWWPNPDAPSLLYMTIFCPPPNK